MHWTRYRCEATTVGGFIQQLAVQYVTHGYWRFVTGHIPERKDPRAIDEKLIERYDLSISSAERARRKKNGRANVQYLRHKRLFVLVATKGRHCFYEEESGQIRDLRRDVLKLRGYAIAYRRGHPSVRIEREEFVRLKAYFEDLAIRRSSEAMVRELRRIRYEPYAPIRGQFLQILRAVNRRRRMAGMPDVPLEAIRLRRRIFKPFEASSTGQVGDKLERDSTLRAVVGKRLVNEDAGDEADGRGEGPLAGSGVGASKESRGGGGREADDGACRQGDEEPAFRASGKSHGGLS